MSNYEPLDYLPPSYSAVMAEKEMGQWNMNIHQSMYEAQKMIKLVQLQCDVLQWKNSYYLKQLEELTARSTEEYDISHRLVEMNQLIEQLTKEAEAALYIKPRKRIQKKKKQKKRPCISSLKYIENQRQIDTSINQIMQAIQDLENDHSSTITVIHNHHHYHHHYYSSHLSSFIQYALYTLTKKPSSSSSSSVRYLSNSIKTKLMLFTTLLISQTFNSHCSPRWARYAHNILSIWKCRSGTQYQFWLDSAHLTLFITRIICKYRPRKKERKNSLCMCK
ncbi:uncharacterized protein RHIMIDRAFT_289129 [Rhizopus microsporus ATCC 52813]|uniref:Uncharacterized protein n=1 Tax=Rhizopus microsporus ATCC 52813 TaxID=1340429 RepID=A0A2G4T6H4_RHIZD|nr:uncharacterized protein RHIMIDRAFT_289129 [Rhizopus microsporus ATCC 52813]PHZ16286.1 hypothetical protein RHIMIDRAFT_289129 [Rhizopus microsporus ATCC 52813]